MSDIVVVGAGGFGREVAQLLRDLGSGARAHRFRGYADDDPEAVRRVAADEAVLGTIDAVAAWPDVFAVCAIGDPAVRRRVVERIGGRLAWVTLRHPTALVGDRCDLGAGTIVCGGSVLTVDISVGTHVHVDRMCTIGHDVRIADFARLSPGCVLSGGVAIGAGAFLGTHAAVLPGVSVGDGAVIGAGAVVLEDVPAGTTVVGVPARPVGQRVVSPTRK